MPDAKAHPNSVQHCALPRAVTFKEYMDSALYDPKNGYYPNRTVKKDFYTAPELHPSFAGVLTREIVKRLLLLQNGGIPGPYSIVEMGSGSGHLAGQILQALHEGYPEWSRSLRYILVERSQNLLLDSVVALSASHDRVMGYNLIGDVLPCAGVFFSNELVDAFPVHVLEKNQGEIREVYVESGKIRLGKLSTAELASHAKALASLAEGERHAVNLEAPRWLAEVGRKLKTGFLITIDYGARYHDGVHNPPRTFSRHFQEGGEALTLPGRDITANVDFETLIGQGSRNGLKLESYSTLSRFLIDGGIEDWIKDGQQLDTVKSRSKVKTLIHPEGMGETYKVLIQSKGL